ncbi:hypothetical protein [Streptomyces sp. SCL15-4]|uniref:hypothetical protein n=1 Tax=Streptomyces sp. SCL15-4 TaxID=2967221 RepID=UPI0029672D9A|nr:hypothetical protein [Streptomyces sp. SCL15-4]
MTSTPDPRIRQLAEAHYRNNATATSKPWNTLDPSIRDYLADKAEAWLRAAIEAGIAPAA